jgi:cell division protein FtsQ
MWDNPTALNRISRLILLVTLVFAIWVVGRATLDHLFPFRQISVIGADHVETQVAARAVSSQLVGGFFSMDLTTLHSQFERMPWVHQAQIRRLWPGHLVIELNEHHAAAAWNDRATLDTHGILFPVTPWTGLPRMYAPEGMEREVARRYGEFVTAVAPIGARIDQIVVSARLSWRVRLSGGHLGDSTISVELGRERMTERLDRFARFYPQAVAAVGPLHRVDMRYPNGFAAEPQRSNHPKPVTKHAQQA